MPKEIGTNGKRFTVDSSGGRGGQSVKAIAPTAYLLHEPFNRNEKAYSNSCEKVEKHVRKQNTIRKQNV